MGGEGGDAVAAGGGECNGWARRPRGPAVTDRLVLLKAEFLELHDMLLESDFQWDESRRFTDLLKKRLDEVMLVPHRQSLPPPR